MSGAEAETIPPSESTALADSVLEELWFGDDDPERSRMEASRSLAAALAISTGLKPFPVVVSRLLTLLANVDTPRVEIIRLIERDPALSLRLLRVANSALYAPSRPIETLNDAVVRLGNRNLTDIVAGIVVFGMFSDVAGLGARVRDHCAGVAAIARVLAMEWRYRGAEHVFLSALLHDVGKLLMIQAGSPRYDLLPAADLRAPDRIHVVERRVTGYDHATLGGHVLTQWQLPHEVAQAVAFHHQPGRAYAAGGEMGLVVSLLRLADRIEYALTDAERVGDVLSTFGDDEAAQYADFSVDQLTAMRPKLLRARSETLAALGA